MIVSRYLMRIVMFYLGFPGFLFLLSCVSYTGERFNGLAAEDKYLSLIYVYSAETGCVDLGQMNADIMVNGVTQFRLAENSFALLKVQPGYYSFSASTDDQLACHESLNPGTYWTPVTIETRSAGLYFLQYNGRSAQCLTTCSRHLIEVDKDLAIDEMRGTRELESKGSE